MRTDVYEALVIDAVRRADISSLARLRSVNEGIEYKLKEAAERAVTLGGLYDAVKSKRYTMSRIRRIALECLLDIEKDDRPSPCRVLGVRDDFRYYLSRLGSDFYVSPSDAAGTEKEKRASSLYSLISGREGNAFYSTRLVTV